MNTKSRCYSQCSDCPNGKPSGWRLVESNCHDAEMYKLRNEKLVPCVPMTEERPQQPVICCKGQKGDKGTCCSSLLLSVKNPQTTVDIPDLTMFAVTSDDSTDLTNWSTIITDQFNSFNNTTGTFTVPQSGNYNVDLVVNYMINMPVTVNPSLDDVPIMEVYDVATGNKIVASTFPAVSLNIPMYGPTTSSGEVSSSGEPIIDINIASVLSLAQVIINVSIPLTANQQVRVRVNLNGLTFFAMEPATIDFSPDNLDTTLTIFKQ